MRLCRKGFFLHSVLPARAVSVPQGKGRQVIRGDNASSRAAPVCLDVSVAAIIFEITAYKDKFFYGFRGISLLEDSPRKDG